MTFLAHSQKNNLGKHNQLQRKKSNHQETWEQWLGRFLDIIGWDPSVCKSKWLHVDILQVTFVKLGYILEIPLKWSIIFLQSWTSTGYFSNSTGSFVTNCRFSPIVAWEPKTGPLKENRGIEPILGLLAFQNNIKLHLWAIDSWTHQVVWKTSRVPDWATNEP